MMSINGDDNRGKSSIEKLPLVSIIVLNWNGEQVIRLSLDSIRRLDYPNIEVIVVDNGSTDRSADIISKEFPDFRLLRNGKNLGFSAGMNVGIKECRGDLIVLYNNDAIAHPTSLSAMIKTIRSEEVGMVGGIILYAEPMNVIGSLGGKFDPITGVIWAEGHGKKLTAEKPEKGSIDDLDYVSGCVLLTKREVINKIGLFDEHVILLGQDLDWCLKARRAGFRCALVPSAVIWHIGSHSFRRMPLRSYAERLKSDLQTITLHLPIIPMFSALFFQIAIAPFFELYFYSQSDISIHSRLQTRMRAFCENLKSLPDLMSKRKEIAMLGHIQLRPRTFELVKFALFRAKSKEFYMGKILQKLE